MEDVDTILQPDVMTPGQYFGRLRPKQATPELRLWFASFQTGLEDLKDGGRNAGDGPAQKVLRRERALAWLESGSEGIGSFIWMCEALGLNPGLLKARLRKQASILLPRAEPRAGRGIVSRGRYRKRGKLEETA